MIFHDGPLRHTATLRSLPLWALLLAAALWAGAQTHAGSGITPICPAAGIRARGADFQPGGIILTAFDRDNIWVYDIDRNRRFPLPDTVPCNRNCRLSPDARWITYVDGSSGVYGKMRLNGTQRTPLVSYAADVEWWADDTLLIWTPGHRAYLRPEDGTRREDLNVAGVVSVQPGGRGGLMLRQQGDGFIRAVVNLDRRGQSAAAEQRIVLGADTPYYNAAAWSPTGGALAYVAPGSIAPETGATGSEIFLIRPDTGAPEQLTNLNAEYGAVRINGRDAGELSWSPDGVRIAFWVVELFGSDATADTGEAAIHVVDVETGAVRVYCDFTTRDHTPDPPRLLWSPDGDHLALSADVPGDDRGFLLLTLDTESGVFTELSSGVYPVFGHADLIAWGLPPG